MKPEPYTGNVNTKEGADQAMLTPYQSETLDRLFADPGLNAHALYYRGTEQLEKRMKNLRKWIPQNVEILLFYDYTMFGGGKNGTAFTENVCFCRNVSESPRTVAYCDIMGIDVKIPPKSGIAELSVQDERGNAIIWRRYTSRFNADSISEMLDTANRLVRLIELFANCSFGTLSTENESLERSEQPAAPRFSPMNAGAAQTPQAPRQFTPTAVPKPPTPAAPTQAPQQFTPTEVPKPPTPPAQTAAPAPAAQPQKPRFTPMEPPSVRNKPRFTPIDPQSLTPAAPAQQKPTVRRLCICYAGADDSSAIWFRDTLSEAPFSCVLQPADASAAALSESDALLLLYTAEMASQATLRPILEAAKRSGKPLVVTQFDGTPVLPLFGELSVPVWDISPLREDEFVTQLMQKLGL